MTVISIDDNGQIVGANTSMADVTRFCKAYDLDQDEVVAGWVSSGVASMDGDTVNFLDTLPIMQLITLGRRAPRTE